MIEKLRRVRRERIPGIGDRRQRLVIDLDRFGGVARLAQGLGDDERDGLTDIANLLDRQQRTRCVVPGCTVAVHERRLAGEVAETFRLNVNAGGDEQNAGHLPRCGRIEPPKARMRHGGAQDEGLRRVRQGYVVRIAAASGDKPQILIAPHGLPNAEFHADLFLCNALDMVVRGAPRHRSRSAPGSS